LIKRFGVIHQLLDTSNSGSQILRFWKGGYSAHGGPGIVVGKSDVNEIWVPTQAAQLLIPLSDTRTISYNIGSISTISTLNITLGGWVL